MTFSPKSLKIVANARRPHFKISIYSPLTPDQPPQRPLCDCSAHSYRHKAGPILRGAKGLEMLTARSGGVVVMLPISLPLVKKIASENPLGLDRGHLMAIAKLLCCNTSDLLLQQAAQDISCVTLRCSSARRGECPWWGEGPGLWASVFLAVLVVFGSF